MLQKVNLNLYKCLRNDLRGQVITGITEWNAGYDQKNELYFKCVNNLPEESEGETLGPKKLNVTGVCKTKRKENVHESYTLVNKVVLCGCRG